MLLALRPPVKPAVRWTLTRSLALTVIVADAVVAIIGCCAGCPGEGSQKARLTFDSYMAQLAQYLILLTIGLPWVGALVMAFGDQRQQHRLALAFALAAGLTALALIPFNSADVNCGSKSGSMLGFTVPDGLGVFLAAIATVIGSLAVLFSMDYMQGEAQRLAVITH